jgi:hypothetical protein
MRQSIFLLLIFLLSTFSFGQQMPKREMRQFFSGATEKRTSGDTISSAFPKKNTEPTNPSGIFGVIEKLKNPGNRKSPGNPSGGDTLVIGIPPLDSLSITGTYFHNGPVMVLGNGILRFKNANATIVGDLFVWGDHALVTADSSYLYFPQQYFYQRSLVVAGKGEVIYRNTTLDHSGLSHNLVLTDSAKIELNNVTNIGFTTCGMNRSSEIDVDGTNQAGEFIIYEQSKLSFKNAKTILLWFQVPGSGVFHYSFPDGDTVQSFTLDNNTPGISGIDYSVHVDTSTDVMWALMPVTGSDVNISDSKIRSVGLWFLGHDTISVSGLVDNSEYIDYTANLNDRSLRIVNSGVQTWSLYPMDTVSLNVTGCIVGEIGSEASCKVITTDAFVDGSGGYWWATNHSFMIGENCMAVNAIRSSENAFFIFAYCTLNQGEASALGNSIMMIVQSELPDLPVLYDAACIWYTFLRKPSSALVDTLVPVAGSAWIDKSPLSLFSDFGWYRMYYQKSGDSLWHPVGEKCYTEKRDEILAEWDTHGLSPGLYYVKLVLTDNSPDSNQNEAVKGINLLPRIFGINEWRSPAFAFSIYPDPVTENSVIGFNLDCEETMDISIVDQEGKIVFRSEKKFGKGVNIFPLGSLTLSKGSYSCILKSRDLYGVRKFIKM